MRSYLSIMALLVLLLAQVGSGVCAAHCATTTAHPGVQAQVSHACCPGTTHTAVFSGAACNAGDQAFAPSGEATAPAVDLASPVGSTHTLLLAPPSSGSFQRSASDARPPGHSVLNPLLTLRV